MGGPISEVRCRCMAGLRHDVSDVSPDCSLGCSDIEKIEFHCSKRVEEVTPDTCCIAKLITI